MRECWMKEHIEAADVVIADVPCSGLGIMGKKMILNTTFQKKA